MFSQEVLHALAMGVGIDAESFAGSGNPISSPGKFSAHSFCQQLRLDFDRDNHADSHQSVTNFPWDHHFEAANATVMHELAKHLQKACSRVLPDKVSWFDSRKNENTTLTVAEIVSKWNQGTAATRHEIGRVLASTLHPMKYADGSDVDYSKGSDSYDQPRERVLPKLYGPWQHELAANNRPNCLGKFQLLVAMGARLGCEMLAITPLLYSSSQMNNFRAQAASQIYRTLESLPFAFSEKRMKSVFRVMWQRKLNAQLPPLQHYAVLYRIDFDKWMLVDPNSGIASMAKDPERLSGVYRSLNELIGVAPGASVLVHESAEAKHLESHLQSCKQAAAKISALSSQLAQTNDWVTLQDLLFEHQIAQSILAWDDFMDVVCSTKKLAFTEAVKRLWTESYPDESLDLANLSSADFDRLRETLVYRFLTRSESEMLSDFRMGVLRGKAFHPVYEISLAPFRMATATASHVAYDLSEEIGHKTEEILYSFGIAEGHLCNVASGVGFNRDSEHVRRALELLELQAVHGTLARRLLSGKGKH